MKKILKIMLCGLVALTLAGCDSDPTPSTGKEVIVNFNDEKMNITVDELYKELKTKYAANYLIETIDKKILDLEYDDTSEAEKYVENRMKILRLSYENDESKLLQALQNAGYQTVASYEDVIRTSYKRTLAKKDYLKSQISESDINKYYEDKVYGDITISHILVKVDSTGDMTEEEKADAENKAQETIKTIYEKLKEGKSFSEVAKEYSQDTATSRDGGRIGTFSKGEMTKRFNEEFENAVLNLAVGKYTTKAITTSYGYHIIYKDDEKEKPALETIKETILNTLVDEKDTDDSKAEYKALIELREKYGIEFKDEEINSQYENAVNNWLYSKDE